MRNAMLTAALFTVFGLASESAHATSWTWITKVTSGPNTHKAVCHYTMDQYAADIYDMYRYKCEQTAPTFWLEERPEPWNCCGPYFGWYPVTGPFNDVKLLYTELCPQETVHNFESEMQFCDGFMHICNSGWTSTFGAANQHWKICKK